MRQTIDVKSKFLAGAVETTEGVNPGTLNLIRTSGLEPMPYEGDTRRREYNGDDGRNNPTVKSNRHTTITFDTDFSGSGDPAVVPAIDPFLRMAGLSRIDNTAAGFDYLISDPADVSTGTLLVRRKAGRTDTGVKYMKYETTGVRGYVGIIMQNGKDPMFQFRDMKGSYYRPVVAEEAAELDLVYNAQEYPEIFENGNVPKFQFGIPDSAAPNGFEMRDVCLEEFNCSNYSGLTVNRSNRTNCPGTKVQAAPIDFTAKVGYDDSFWELVESHQNIITVPFSMMHGTSAGNQLSINSSHVQIHDIKESDLDGELGMDLSCTFLDRPVLTVA